MQKKELLTKTSQTFRPTNVGIVLEGFYPWPGLDQSIHMTLALAMVAMSFYTSILRAQIWIRTPSKLYIYQDLLSTKTAIGFCQKEWSDTNLRPRFASADTHPRMELAPNT